MMTNTGASGATAADAEIAQAIKTTEAIINLNQVSFLKYCQKAINRWSSLQ